MTSKLISAVSNLSKSNIFENAASVGCAYSRMGNIED